jgi:cellulose synthase/poly-beta-1,6-N-acetylglucosamine synthase-like glycosyltransferase
LEASANAGDPDDWPPADQHVSLEKIDTMFLLFLLALFAYPFVLYLPVLTALARALPYGRSEQSEEAESVALVICALNERNIIGQKIENSLALDYFPGQLEILVVSDGSTDGTAEAVQQYASAGVRLINQPHRRGKVKNLIEVIPTLHQDIVVLSDANVLYDSQAIKNLVRRFRDKSVGCVSGKVVLTDTAAPLNTGTGDYYSMEWRLQEAASRLHSMVGADGAMYAMRRELFTAPPADTVIEDFVIPMAVIRSGRRVVFEPTAIGWEQGSASLKEEFRRKTRIGAGAMQSLLRGNGWPGRVSARVWFVFLSHKLLRWISPLVGLAVLAMSLLSLGHTISKVIVGGFLILSVAAGLRILLRHSYRVLDAPFYFLFGQVAAGVGLIKGLTGTQSVLWVKANR